MVYAGSRKEPEATKENGKGGKVEGRIKIRGKISLRGWGGKQAEGSSHRKNALEKSVIIMIYDNDEQAGPER